MFFFLECVSFGLLFVGWLVGWLRTCLFGSYLFSETMEVYLIFDICLVVLCFSVLPLSVVCMLLFGFILTDGVCCICFVLVLILWTSCHEAFVCCGVLCL